MKRYAIGIGLGIAGVVVALGLTLGTVAITGSGVGGPPRPPTFDLVSSPSATPTEHHAGGGSQHDGGGNDRGATASPSRPAAPTVTQSPTGSSGSSEGSGSGPSGSGSDSGDSGGSSSGDRHGDDHGGDD